MSGGSYDYLYSKIRDMAGEIYSRDVSPAGCAAHYGSTAALRKAFAKHLQLVAKACRAIEWNDSGDGDQDERKHIEACLGGTTAELEVLLEQARDIRDQLMVGIERAKGVQP